MHNYLVLCCVPPLLEVALRHIPPLLSIARFSVPCCPLPLMDVIMPSSFRPSSGPLFPCLTCHSVHLTVHLLSFMRATCPAHFHFVLVFLVHNYTGYICSTPSLVVIPTPLVIHWEPYVIYTGWRASQILFSLGAKLISQKSQNAKPKKEKMSQKEPNPSLSQ